MFLHDETIKLYRAKLLINLPWIIYFPIFYWLMFVYNIPDGSYLIWIGIAVLRIIYLIVGVLITFLFFVEDSFEFNAPAPPHYIMGGRDRYEYRNIERTSFSQQWFLITFRYWR